MIIHWRKLILRHAHSKALAYTYLMQPCTVSANNFAQFINFHQPCSWCLIWITFPRGRIKYYGSGERKEHFTDREQRNFKFGLMEIRREEREERRKVCVCESGNVCFREWGNLIAAKRGGLRSKPLRSR